MATNAQTAATAKTKKPAKPPVAPFIRINDQLKRAALANKLTHEELAKIAKLAEALQAFVTAPAPAPAPAPAAE